MDASTFDLPSVPALYEPDDPRMMIPYHVPGSPATHAINAAHAWAVPVALALFAGPTLLVALVIFLI